MIQNLEGENFGKIAHSKDWQIKFLRMNKIPYDTKFWSEKNFAKMVHGKDWWITSENTQNTRRLKTALAMLKIIKFYVLTT